MAMENKRIIQLSTERTNLTSGDYVMVDSDADGSAKYRLDRLKETDNTLSVSGMAADAAATGQAISDEEEARSDADTALGKDVDNLKSALKDTNGKIVSLQIGDVTVLSLTKAMVKYPNQYFNGDGSLSAGSQHNVVQITDPTIKTLIMPVPDVEIASFLYTVMVKNGDTILLASKISNTQKTAIDLSSYTYTEILINWFGSNTSTPFFSTVELEYDRFANLTDLSNLDSTLPHFDNLNNSIDVSTAPWNIPYGQEISVDMADIHNIEYGYCDGGGIHSSSSHKHLFIPAKYVKSITITAGTTTPVFGYVYYLKTKNSSSASQIVGTSGGTYTYSQKQPDGYVCINLYDGSGYAHEFTVTIWEESETPIICHSVNRPFDFDGKTAVFTGDSITYGFTSGSTTTQNNYPKLFSQKAGLTYTNAAQGGACFVSGYNEVLTVTEQVEAITTTPDYIFIAGGINDWQLGVTMSELKTTLVGLCQWINTNKPNSEVIWILPINQAGYDKTHVLNTKASVDDYRRAIYETVKQYDVGKYSVVNGKLFGFPEYGADSAYTSAMFGDLLHPTELGYKTLYVPGLLTALC